MTQKRYDGVKTNREWKKILTPEQYMALREKKTERPFTGTYYYFFEKGIYCCAACGNELFRSEAKFDSGTGWPSFFAPITPFAVDYQEDSSRAMERIEAVCGLCGSHLGHVFDDGPPPTGKRYCINSLSLDFKASETETT